MDIAKIRKKLKDAGAQEEAEPQGGASAVPAEGEPSQPDSPPLQPVEMRDGTVEIKMEDAGSALVDLLTFTLGREEFAFRIGQVLEIVRLQKITRIPNSKDFLLGVTSLRGKLIPVIDLSKRLFRDTKTTGEDKKQKIMMLRGPKGPIGVVIDRVIGVMRPSVSEISEAPPHLPEAEMKFIEGVAIIKGRFISIIRVEEAVDIW